MVWKFLIDVRRLHGRGSSRYCGGGGEQGFLPLTHFPFGGFASSSTAGKGGRESLPLPRTTVIPRLRAVGEGVVLKS